MSRFVVKFIPKFNKFPKEMTSGSKLNLNKVQNLITTYSSLGMQFLATLYSKKLVTKFDLFYQRFMA